MDQHTLQLLARWGYAARGSVYLLVGGLAIVAGIDSGKAPGSKDALKLLLNQPLGSVWVAGIAAGLLLFAFWRILQALLNADHLSNDWKGAIRRLGYGFSAAVYVSLAGAAVSLVSGRSVGSTDAEISAKDWTAEVLALPFGQGLVGGLGGIMFAVGLGLMAKAVWGQVDRRLMLDRHIRRWVIPFGRIGFAARGVVFAVAGAFLTFSAIDANPGEVRGLAGSLRALQDQSYGWAILGLVAMGLVAFGLFEFVEAYYRQISTDEAEKAARSLKAKIAT
jgi:hypothetical protein